MFISTMHLYPSQTEHKWAFGSLPQTLIDKELTMNPFMRDMYTEASPFEINGSQITYDPEFKNLDRFKPQNAAINEANIP